MMLTDNFRRLLHIATAGLLASVLLGCASTPIPTADGRVYHCVATNHPIPPPNTWAKKTPLERFEYGAYVDENRPTISGNGYCSVLPVPNTAYLRYQIDGRVLEKRFDLSTLSVQRVRGKEVEFFVNGETVEVRLLTRVEGALPNREIIDRR